MTIIVFLVDTSASMQQKAFVSGRSTLLDVAKGAVEFFVKMRQKSTESRGDRYMLLTFEEYPKNIKAGWKENLQTFMNELKNLEACGMTTMGTALKQVSTETSCLGVRFSNTRFIHLRNKKVVLT